jgi:hypothetical protein
LCCRVLEDMADNLVRLPVEYDAAEIKNDIHCYDSWSYWASAT